MVFVLCAAGGIWRGRGGYCYKTYGLPSGSYTSSPTIRGSPAAVGPSGPATPSSNLRLHSWKAFSLSFLFAYFCEKMASVKATFITILLAVATIGVVAARDIPEFLHICQTNDPHYEVCITESIEHLKPYLKTGVPEYNIPSLEPLKLKKLTFTPTSSIKVDAADIDVFGASNFQIKKVKLDFNTLLFLVDVALPNIRVEGKYLLDGRLLLLPIRGSGPMHGNFSNCLGACKIQVAKFIDQDGEEKMRITDFKLKVSVAKGTLKLDNLFGGEQALGDVINSAINNNFGLFLRELLPLVEKALSDAFQNIAGNIVEQFAFAQLFPGA